MEILGIFCYFIIIFCFVGEFCLIYCRFSLVTSSEAVTTTSQLQARLSQPPSATGNREQLRYLLQRGPSAATSTPAVSTAQIGSASASTAQIGSGVAESTAQIGSATSTTTSGVTTTKVWVPGDDLVEANNGFCTQYLTISWKNHAL